MRKTSVEKYWKAMTAVVLSEEELRTILKIHGYEVNYNSSQPNYVTELYNAQERFLTRGFWESQFKKCGTELHIERFPLNIELELNLGDQFIDLEGDTWHYEWFKPKSFKQAEKRRL